MNIITGKISTKNQITIPKTVRDFLGVSEGDTIQFLIEEGRVSMEKGRDVLVCPFCRGQDFYETPCEFCEEKGIVEKLNEESLTQKLYAIFLRKGAVVTLDTTEPFYRIDVATEDELLKLYREHFQMEYIKLVLRHYKVKALLDRELQEQLTGYLKLDASRTNFARWWDLLIEKHSN